MSVSLPPPSTSLKRGTSLPGGIAGGGTATTSEGELGVPPTHGSKGRMCSLLLILASLPVLQLGCPDLIRPESYQTLQLAKCWPGKCGDCEMSIATSSVLMGRPDLTTLPPFRNRRHWWVRGTHEHYGHHHCHSTMDQICHFLLADHRLGQAVHSATAWRCGSGLGPGVTVHRPGLHACRTVASTDTVFHEYPSRRPTWRSRNHHVAHR